MFDALPGTHYHDKHQTMSLSQPSFSVSLVVFHNPPEMLLNAVKSCLASPLCRKIYVIDNSGDNSLQSIFTDPRIEYEFSGKNLGFGAGHNRVLLHKPLEKYHLILNPDVIFATGTMEALIDHLEQNPDAALIIPKVINPDGSFQYAARKVLPTPFMLIGRLLLSESWQRKFRYFDRYEMRQQDPDSISDVPCISGCFITARSSALLDAKGFDERYFMYMEDIDLCHRIGLKHRIIYFPKVKITHLWARESRKNFRLLKAFAISAVRYFNKWGWW